MNGRILSYDEKRGIACAGVHEDYERSMLPYMGLAGSSCRRRAWGRRHLIFTAGVPPTTLIPGPLYQPLGDSKRPIRIV
jgi:hypothetical protein